MKRYGVKRLCRACDREVVDVDPSGWDCPSCGFLSKALFERPLTRLASVIISPVATPELAALAELEQPANEARPLEQLSFDFDRVERPGLAKAGAALRAPPPHSEQQAAKRKREA